MICLDANIVIAALKDDRSTAMMQIAQALRDEHVVAVSAIVLFELSFGIEKSIQRERNALRLAAFVGSDIEVLAFDTEDAVDAGDIRAFLMRNGTPIGPYDVLIAAQARRRDAVLITANTREFSRVPRLKIEDWTQASF